ncbi:hypothetical protein CYMTET_21905 [Cymbomonas tetramitiformis]|uniref:Uncharacterized protein n=1 Tax=Cymbomonas tetramitiformis TaxID=36881 RepID=A0AAE0G184_9CHLO|nr:hypothetical protein CYMTET_21905 [Cymbomonas tetramitiformis]
MHVVLESADGNYIGYVDARGMCLLAEDIKYNGEVSHYIKRHEADIQDLVAANDGLSRDDIIIYLDVPYTNKYRTFMHPLLADRLGASLLRRRVSCPILEKHVRDTVAKSLNGTTEVVADAGRIGVVTDDEIIEVKHVAAWKHAYGQVKSYMTCIGARHYGRIHLFGTKTEIDRRSLLIESTLAELDSTVRVTYEYLSVTDRTPVVREGLKALQSRMREVDEWMEDLLEFTRKVSPSAIEKRAVAIERDDDDDHGGSAERMATSDDGDDESDGNDDDDGDDGDNIDDDDDESDGIARDDDVIGFKCKEFAGPTKTVTMHVVIANTDGTYLGYVDARGDLEWEAVDDVDVKRVPVVADENVAALSLKDADDDAVNADEEEDAIIADVEEEENELEPLPAAEAAWRALYDRRGTAENAKLTSDFAPMLAYMYHKADEPLILSEARAYFNRYCHRGATSKSTTTTSEQVTTTNSNTAPVSSARQSLLAGFFKRGPLAGFPCVCKCNSGSSFRVSRIDACPSQYKTSSSSLVGDKSLDRVANTHAAKDGHTHLNAEGREGIGGCGGKDGKEGGGEDGEKGGGEGDGGEDGEEGGEEGGGEDGDNGTDGVNGENGGGDDGEDGGEDGVDGVDGEDGEAADRGRGGGGIEGKARHA